MYQALYRKYRPSVFADVVGQEHITTTLRNSLESGKVFHAYLFTGTRGTGKTTCAKILANAVCCEHPVNGEPCGECAACKLIAEGTASDINEIDAASNNSVNDIRDLKEQVTFLPVALKYRVYIIDEVHMLSISAFNALLKTLEEPPAHVIFILATTEVHKLPATILSRCQRYDFKRLEPEVICARMNTVAEKEGFTLTDSAALKIAGLADGGMRDALSILDQCAARNSEITVQTVSDVCGIAGTEETYSLISAIMEKNTVEAIKTVDALYRNSVDMKKLVFELIGVFRDLMMVKTVKDLKGLIICSDDELQKLKNFADGFTLSEIIENLSLLQSVGENMSVSAPRSDVELAVVRLCTPELKSSLSGLQKRIEMLEKTVESIKNGKVEIKSSNPTGKTLNQSPQNKPLQEDFYATVSNENVSPNEKAEQPAAENISNAENSAKTQNGLSDEPVPVSQWPEILEIVKQNCPLMGGVLLGSKAYIGGNRLLIDSKLKQFKELINSDAKYRDYIRNAAEQVLGVSYNLGPYRPKNSKEQTEIDPLVEFAKSLEEN